MSAGPLAGYRVVDLEGSVATATCARLFADFGARVVNVEPRDGQATRHLAPVVVDERSPWSALHALLSPNKESVLAEHAADALRVVESADVVLRGAASELSFDRIRDVAPEAVVVAVTGFGLTGPWSGRPANDATLCAHIGLVKGIGRPDRAPVLPSGHPVEILGGVTAFVAAVGELLGRALCGAMPAVEVDVSLLESAMCLTEVAPVAFFNGGQPLPRLGLNRFLPNGPAGIYAAKDGWLGVTALTPRQWQDLCELVGLPALGHEPRYQSGLQRLLDADKIDAELAPVLRQRTAEEWFHAGQARRIPLALVPTMADILSSEQIAARDGFREITLPGGRSVRAPGAPFRLHRKPALRSGAVSALGSSSGRPPVAARARRVASGTLRAPLREPSGRPGLLRGIRIVDLTMGWAGPLAARQLADLGAEVLKVESRTRFDWWRGWEVTDAFLREHTYEKSHAFNTVNRNKLGLTLDLTEPRGIALLKRLLEDADAVIENYSAGVMAKLGLDERELRRLNPRLVVVSMPPFGRGGPLGDYRGYGSTVEHASGLPHLNGAPEDPPTMLHIALGDPVAGVHGAAALVLALLHQRRTGEGQFVDLSQVEALTHLGLHGLAHELFLGSEPPRLGNRHPLDAPHGAYPCLGDDQWLVLAVQTPDQWVALRDLVGAAELRAPELDSADARRRQHDRIDRVLSEWTRTRDRDEIAEQLTARGIPAAPVFDVNEVLTHPQLEARGFWQWLERDHVGVQPHPSAPHRRSAEPHGIEMPAPTLGEHTREVLGGLLGVSEAELLELERDGIIGRAPAPLERVDVGEPGSPTSSPR